MRSIKNKKGVAGTEILTLSLIFIVTIVALGMVLPIGQALTHSTANSIDRSGWDATENATYTSTQSNIQTGYSLFANAPLLAAAGGVISLIVVSFGVMLGRQGGI